MDPEDLLCQTYTRPGVRAWLTCEGNGCVLDFTLDGADGPPPQRAAVEVLFQPRDQRGLPRGAPMVLLRGNVRLRAQSHQGVGRFWLADIRPSLARQCHFRITADDNREV